MPRYEVISMGMRELDRLKTIQAVLDGRLPQTVAAERLGLSDRRIRGLLERYSASGPRSFNHVDITKTILPISSHRADSAT